MKESRLVNRGWLGLGLLAILVGTGSVATAGTILTVDSNNGLLSTDGGATWAGTAQWHGTTIQSWMIDPVDGAREYLVHGDFIVDADETVTAVLSDAPEAQHPVRFVVGNNAHLAGTFEFSASGQQHRAGGGTGGGGGAGGAGGSGSGAGGAGGVGSRGGSRGYGGDGGSGGPFPSDGKEASDGSNYYLDSSSYPWKIVFCNGTSGAAGSEDASGHAGYGGGAGGSGFGSPGSGAGATPGGAAGGGGGAGATATANGGTWSGLQSAQGGEGGGLRPELRVSNWR